MIQIKQWFSAETATMYLERIKTAMEESLTQKGRSLPSQIQFIDNCASIQLDKLLTLSRQELFEIPGIKLYVALCRFYKLSSANFTQADYLHYLWQSFPDEVKCDIDDDSIVYTIADNPPKAKAEIKKNKLPRTVSFENREAFFNIFLSIIEYNGSVPSTFDEFKRIAKNGVKNKVSTQNNNIRNTIDYDFMPDDLRHAVLSSLNIKCCPYCNRQYITIWKDKSTLNHATADLDHYYPKSTYPLFALSLFNFVPACQICNSRMKGSKELEALYPYEEGMNEYRFNCIPIDGQTDTLVNLWLSHLNKKANKLFDLYKIIISSESINAPTSEAQLHNDRILNSIQMFHLDEVYQTHIDAAISEMLKIRIYLSGHYSKYAKETLSEIGIEEKSTDNQLNTFSEDEMRNIILGFVYNGQDILDQPLGKLMNDIFEGEMTYK